MENAGRSVAEFIQSRFPNLERRRIVVLCGKGNNGGDGFVVARHLKKMGAKPFVYLIGDPRQVKGDAATNLNRWKKVGKLNSERAEKAERALECRRRLDRRGRAPGNRRSRCRRRPLARGDYGGQRARAGLHRRCRGHSVRLAGGHRRGRRRRHRRGLHDHVHGAEARADRLRAAAGTCGSLTVRQIGSPPDLIDQIGKGSLRWSEAAEFAAFASPAQSRRE